MYYTFYFKPVLQYGILVHGETCITHLNKIAVLRGRLVRLIFFNRRAINIESDLIQPNILSVQQLFL